MMCSADIIMSEALLLPLHRYWSDINVGLLTSKRTHPSCSFLYPIGQLLYLSITHPLCVFLVSLFLLALIASRDMLRR